MTEDHPKIPFNHFMKELYKAMDLVLQYKNKDKKEEREIIYSIREKAKQSRPWAYLLKAYQNHHDDFNWLENWCQNCLKISRFV